jgi:hypothetical protein
MLKAAKRQVLTGERMGAARNGTCVVTGVLPKLWLSQYTIVNRMDDSMVGRTIASSRARLLSLLSFQVCVRNG